MEDSFELSEYYTLDEIEIKGYKLLRESVSIIFFIKENSKLLFYKNYNTSDTKLYKLTANYKQD